MYIQRVFAFIFAATIGLLVAPTASGIVYDLNTTRTVAVNTIYGTAIFTTDFTKTAGTGVIDPFLSIQDTGWEQGYNSNTGNFDTKRDGQYTRDQKLSDMATVNINGVSYFSFLLDINESNSADKSFISLDALKLYTRPTALTSPSTNIVNLGTLRFDIDAPTDVTFVYNDLNSGSGQGDVAFFIPTSAFVGVGPNSYLYMYQKFGDGCVPGVDVQSDGGFEETTAVSVVPIPETDAILPLLAVLGVVVAGPFIRRCFQA